MTASINSRALAAQLWCDERTKHIEMDSALAEVIAEKIDQYIDVLFWVAGSADFDSGGLARKGWMKLGQPLIDEWLRVTLASDLDDTAADPWPVVEGE